jgi:hypothetical protein
VFGLISGFHREVDRICSLGVLRGVWANYTPRNTTEKRISRGLLFVCLFY